MSKTENPEIIGNTSSRYNAFKLGVKLFTFINFFLALILISDFFLEPEYRKTEMKNDTADSKSFSLSLGEDSLKISSGESELRENEQTVTTPIFGIEKYHKYKADNDDGYSVDLEPLALPFIAAILWLISFIAVIKPRDKDKGAEPALMYQILLLPIIVSLVYWVKLYNYLL